MYRHVLRSFAMVAAISTSLLAHPGTTLADTTDDLSFGEAVSVYTWDTVSDDLYDLPSMTLEDGSTVFFDLDSREPTAVVVSINVPADASFNDVLLTAIDAVDGILTANPDLQITLVAKWGDVEIILVLEANLK